MKNWTLLSALTLLIACGDKDDSGEGDARGEDILALTGDSAAGETVYTGNCSGCHQADGSGTDSFPSLIDSTASDEEKVEIILEGSGSMMSFSGLDDQEIADVVAYINLL